MVQGAFGGDFPDLGGVDRDHKDLAGGCPIRFTGKPEGHQRIVGKIYQPGGDAVVLQVRHALQGRQIVIGAGVAELHFVNKLVEVSSEKIRQELRMVQRFFLQATESTTVYVPAFVLLAAVDEALVASNLMYCCDVVR